MYIYVTCKSRNKNQDIKSKFIKTQQYIRSINHTWKHQNHKTFCNSLPFIRQTTPFHFVVRRTQGYVDNDPSHNISGLTNPDYRD